MLNRYDVRRPKVRTLFPGLLGNEKLKAELSPLLAAEGSPFHALIVEGPQGSGKYTFAVQVAAALSCARRGEADGPLPCCECASCRKILRGISPDVITVDSADRATLGVDTVRDLRSDVHIYPNDLDLKVYIIKGADTMTAQAQNAFLLTLEEPPAYAVFILLCRNSGALLETVRSRAPVLRMQPLPPDLTAEAVMRAVPGAAGIRSSDPARFEAAVMSSAGSAGRAIELLNSREGRQAEELRSEVAEFVSLCAVRGGGAEAMGALVRGCGNTRDGAVRFLSSAADAVRDLSVIKRAQDAPLLFYADRGRAAELSDRFPSGRLVALYDAVSDAVDAAGRGMNIRLTLMSLLSDARII